MTGSTQDGCAPSGNRTRVTSMATRYYTTKPMVLRKRRRLKLSTDWMKACRVCKGYNPLELVCLANQATHHASCIVHHNAPAALSSPPPPPPTALGNLRVFKMDVHVVRVLATPLDAQPSTSPATNKQQSPHTRQSKTNAAHAPTSSKQNKNAPKKML